MRNYLTWTVKKGGVHVTNGTVNNSADRHSPWQATKLTCATIQKKIKNKLKVNCFIFMCAVEGLVFLLFYCRHIHT